MKWYGTVVNTMNGSESKKCLPGIWNLKRRRTSQIIYSKIGPRYPVHATSRQHTRKSNIEWNQTKELGAVNSGQWQWRIFLYVCKILWTINNNIFFKFNFESRFIILFRIKNFFHSNRRRRECVLIFRATHHGMLHVRHGNRGIPACILLGRCQHRAVLIPIGE